jgi:hypothetical protein
MSNALTAPRPHLDTALSVLQSLPEASVTAFDHELRCAL